MSSTIDNLPSGAPAQPGDELPIQRGANNFKLSIADIVSDVPATSPGGNPGDIQYNNSGSFGGVAQVPLAKGGTNVDLSASGSSTAVLAQDASHVISARALVAADIPNLDASKITTGALALARGGTNADLSASGSSTAVLAQDASHVISARALVAADIPNLDAAKITTGTLALARGGTNADLSATGGANQFLKQTSSGGAVTVAALVAGDVPTGIVTWDLLGNAAGALTLSNAGNATTFNQTSAVLWTWANSTAATSGGITGNSPILKVASHLFTSGVDTVQSWTLQSLMTPTSALTFTITNLAEASNSIVTATIGAHTLVAGDWVTVSGITGTFSYLNNVNVPVNAVTGTTITFLDPTTHGTQGSAASNGTVTQIPINTFAVTPSGSAGRVAVVLPAIGTSATPNDTWSSVRFAGQTSAQGIGGSSSLPLCVFNGSGSSQAFITFFIGAQGAQVQRGGITIGNNSNGNSIVTLSALAGSNLAVCLEGGNTTNVTNPCVILTNAQALSATTGTQVGLGVGVVGAGGGGLFSFAPTSGTAVFQANKFTYTINQTGGANGNVTGILVNAIETAVGGTHLLMDLQAGSAGTTSEFSIKNNGKVTNYGAIATIGNGVPSEYATVDLTAQAAAIAATTLYAVPAGGAGRYRVSWVASVTTVDGAASVLGGAGGFQILYTDGDDSVVKTSPRTVTAGVDTDATNTTATAISGCIIVNAKASTNIQYQMGYTSTTPGQMKYNLHVVMEAL